MKNMTDLVVFLIITLLLFASGYVLKALSVARGDIKKLENDRVKLEAELAKFKPEGHWYQHEETGQIGTIDEWQVEQGFFKRNPRLIDCGIVYVNTDTIDE
jgi:hypothetical protein